MLNYKTSKINTCLLKIKKSFNDSIIVVNSSFNFKNSYESELYFSNLSFYNTYSRINNPVLLNLKKKLKTIDNCNNFLLLASGMASIFNSIISLLKPYNYILIYKNLFNSTMNLFIFIMYKFNIYLNFFNSNENFILKIISNKYELFYIENPDNPFFNILSIKNISYITNKYNIYLVLDNTLSTSILQKSINLGSDLIVYSSTKYIDGEGKLLGGVLGSNNPFLFKLIFNFYKLIGSSFSVFNSWILLKNLKLLIIRIKFKINNSVNFLNLIKFNKFLFNLYYSGFYKKLDFFLFIFNNFAPNPLISLDVNGFNDELKRLLSWKLLNNFNYIKLTANLGDINSTITHPSTTTHLNLTFLEKKNININESLIRISLGCENIKDLFIYFSKSFNYF